MIEFDYKIERDEGDKTEVYLPKGIPKKLQNVVYIEGPNSLGKSTLLNILAIAFHGLKNDSIHPSLKRKMKNLIESNYQTLTFSIRITKGDVKLLIEKTNPRAQELKVYEFKGGKKTLLSLDSLSKKYRLIYDIPENPTERIHSLLDEVQDIQNYIGRKISRFKEHLLEIISDIRSSRDPKQIEKLEKDINDFNSSLASTKKSLNQKKNLLDELEKSVYFVYYHEYLKTVNSLRKNIEKQQKLIKNKSRKKIKRNQKFGNHIEWARAKLKEAYPIFKEIEKHLKKLLPDEREHTENWVTIDLDSVLRTFEFDSKIEKEIDYFRKVLNDRISEIEKKESYVSTKFFEDLLDLLNRYDTLNIKIPGIEKTITEIRRELEKKIEDNEYDLLYVKNAKKALQLFDDLEEPLNHISTYNLPTLRNLKDKLSDVSKLYEEKDLADSKLEELEQELKNAKNKLDQYDKLYAQKNKPKQNEIIPLGQKLLQRFGVLTEEQLLDEIKKLQLEIRKLSDELTAMQSRIERKRGELDSAKQKKQHPLTHKLAELESLLQVSMDSEYLIRNNFVKFSEDLKNANDPKSPEQEQYNTAIGRYIAERIGEIRHINRKYQVDSIDLIKGIIVTVEKKCIRLDDMGTGQSQSAYLLGLLHSTDDRKIVALFDEVAMMDSKSIGPVLSKLKDLYNQGKLLIGVMVQKAEKINIIPQVGD